MITPEQQKWIDSLSEERYINIVPYDPRTEELFERIKNKITSLLGPEVLVEHGGASSFGISGQDEIDIAIVADKEKFDEYIPKLETLFGEVRSRYTSRARFEVKEDNKKIDLKIVDISHPNYLEGKIFEKYLRNHPEDLERYRVLKEESNGLTVKEYYRRKTHFINDIIGNMIKTINKSIDIHASKEKIWEILTEQPYLDEWTSAFMENSKVKGKFKQGEQILYFDANAMGVVGKVTEYKPLESLKVSIVAEIKNGEPDFGSADSKRWEGAYDHYHLAEKDGITVLSLETAFPAEFYDDFVPGWKKMLDKVKVLAEKK